MEERMKEQEKRWEERENELGKRVAELDIMITNLRRDEQGRSVRMREKIIEEVIKRTRE